MEISNADALKILNKRQIQTDDYENVSPNNPYTCGNLET